MKARSLTCLVAAAGLLGGQESPAAAATLAIRGETVYTMAGSPLRPGVVLIRDGKIAAVGAPAAVELPTGTRVLEARIVTPGLIDAHATVGLSGLLNQPQDQDQVDRTAALQPELRALDAYNARDPLVGWLRSFGITTIHTGHGPGALISGQTMVVKTWPPNADRAVVVPAAMVATTLGPGATTTNRSTPPGTAAKAVAMLRAELLKAADYARKRAGKDEDKRPARDLHLEALQEVLEGRRPLLVTVHRHLDILAALRVAAEFKLKLVLDGVADAALVLPELRASGFPVLVHPTMARAMQETQNASFETPAQLQAAGVPVAFQSGYEAYVPKTRVALLEAGVAVANGFPADHALAALTLGAARILGVADRIGSLEPGKDADVALFDGDPFEYTTHCSAVVIDGEITDLPGR